MGQFHAVLGIFLALIEVIAEPKISVVTALLPPRGPGQINAGAGARLRVEASGGCFRWVVSQRPDLVVVEEPLQEELPPRRAAEKAAEAACQEACLHAGRQFLPDETQADDGCQPVAIIRSIAEKIHSNVEKVLVLAQDIQQPGVELRCEVYIANIDRIEVETSVRRINVDDVETLGVKAYDKQGNVFSSLEGLEFRWRLGDASILQSPKLVDSAFKLSPVRRALAEAGAQPDTVLLQGVATGRTTVRANLTIGTPVIVSPEVHLTVLENIVVMPSLLYAPPMAHLQLQLKILRGPRRPLEELPPVQLPVPHFHWHAQTEGEGVLFVEPEMGRVVTQRLGSGRVLAVDSRIENNTAATVIYVTNPVTLRFWTQPLWRAPGISIMKQIPGWKGSLESGWEDEELQLLRTATTGVSSDEPVLQLVQGRTYALKLQLEDKNSQLMQIPLNLRAKAYCQASNASAPPLQLLHQAPNSAVLIFKAVELGEGQITIENLTLEADKDDKARNLNTKTLKLFAKQAFYVAPQLEPVVPVGGPMLLPRWHSYLLQVRGTGRQVFAMRSQPAGAITVSQDGRVQAGGQLANGELTVQDVRNPHNNFTLRVLVRRAGRLVLQPRYLQIRLPRDKVTEQDEEPVLVRARPEDGSEDADVCEAMCRMLRNLTFWNCTALFSSERISAEVSNRTVASVGTVSSGLFATCNIIQVRPLAPGRFQLTARAQEADASEPLPSTPLPFEVYKPLEWQLLGVKDHDEVAAAQADQAAALVLAPCSSIRLRLAEGPRQMTVPGRDSWNLTVGPHISVSRIGSRSFQVTCMQVTPGPVRLKGQVTHAPSDPLHGEVFVDNLTLWMRCSVPARVQAVAEVDDLEDEAVVDKEPRLALGVQRGQATPFRARFVDAFGRTMINASEYMLRWSLSPSSKEGVPFQKAWLAIKKETSAASINVPKDATVGATAKLGLEVSLPPASLCQNSSMATLAALPLPSSDELPVVVARKLELRWPGHPQKARFAMFKNLSIVVEAGFGTGRARLEILSGHDILKVLEPSQICGGHELSTAPCVPALWIGSPCNASRADDVQRWFLLPIGQGTASLAFWDPDLVGARPQPLEMTIRAAKQLDVSLLGEDTSHDGRTVLVVRGTDRPLRVDVRDADGQALGMVNWLPLGLKVHSSDPGALEVKNSSRCGEYECLCHTPGTYRLFADMQDYPNGTIHSRVLHVECLPEFDVVLKDIVVMPGQAFELAFTGGPTKNERTYFDYVSSAPDVVSIDNEVGLVLALKPGEADLSVRLLERPSGREIARKGAHVTVRVPTAASIGAVESLTGASREETSPALLRELEDPLRLRARIWSGDLELTPLLLALAASKVSPLTSNLKGKNLLTTALDMGETIVEATEAASQTALQLATSSGLSGSDAANAAAAHGVSCRFIWTTDPSVSLTSGIGALAVELRANASSPEQLEISLVAECPLGRGYESLQLEAKTVLPVLPMLKLLVPTGPCSAYPRILVPLHGRVPLSFSMPRSQLKVEILGGAAVQLIETAEMVEVEAGLTEGEASLKVEVLASLYSPPMEISVSSRKVFAARMDSVPSRLPLSASAVCPLFLVDATGQILTLPSNFQVEASSSLTSVVTAEAETFAGGAALHLRAVGEGCTLLSFVVRLPDSRQLPSDIAEVCVVQGALVGHGPLLVQPGARLNLDAEEFASTRGFSSGRPPIAFSLRLLELPSSCRTLEEAASSLAKDLSETLAEGLAKRGGRSRALPIEVTATAARYAIRQAENVFVEVEVDLQVSASDLGEAAGESGELGLFDLAEVLWQENVSRSETLQLLDRSWGVHGAAKASSLSDQRCEGCCVPSSRCRSCCHQAPRVCGKSGSIAGWSSTHPRLLAVEAVGASPHAIAQAPGVATLHYCDGVVSADIQVIVSRPGELLPEPPQGGPTEALRARNLLSNQVSSQLAVSFRSFREGGTQTEDELRSGPFVAQNIRLVCEPMEVAMGDFFSFEAVGETCILKPRDPRDSRANMSAQPSAQSAPLQIGLAASLQGSTSRGHPVEWQFIPQFVVVKANEALAPSQVCATLTTSSPSAEVPVWTGGHHIEADLDGQIKSRRRGNLTLEVQPSHLPVTFLRIQWNDPVDWGSPEEVNLRLSSPATGQVEVYRLRIEPSSQVPCAPEAGGWSLLEILALAAAMAALLWLVLRLCTRTAAPQDQLGAAFQGVGAGPILSGDPFAGPHAVSPFNALG